MNRSFVIVIFSLLTQTTFAQGLAWNWAANDISAGYIRDINVVADSKANRYIAGITTSPVIVQGDTIIPQGTSGRQLLLAKYNPQGKLLWAKVWQGAAGYNRKWLVVDPNDDLILAGCFEDSMRFGFSDLRENGIGTFIARLHSDGDVWALTQFKRLSPKSSAEIYAIGCDSASNVYWFGLIVDSVRFGGSEIIADGARFALVKHEIGLGIWWANLSCSPNLKTEETGLGCILAVGDNHVAVLGSGSGFLALSSDTLNLRNPLAEIFLLSYNQKSGNLIYARSFPHSGVEYAQTGDLASKKDDVYLSGAFAGVLILDSIIFNSGGETTRASFFAKLDSNGRVQWAHEYSESHLGGPFLASIIVKDSFIYATGDYFSNVDFNGVILPVDGIFVVQYDLDGKGLWAISSSKSFFPTGESVTTSANEVTVVGSFSGKLQFGDTLLESKAGTIFLANLGQPTNSVRSARFSGGSITCYPNPVSSILRIVYPIEEPANATVALFNLLGEKVMTKELPHTVAGTYQIEADVSSLPNGAYFVRILVGNSGSSSAFLQIVR